MWTAGWVEPGVKWMMVTIHLTPSPNPWVGPVPLAPKGCIRYVQNYKITLPPSQTLSQIFSFFFSDTHLGLLCGYEAINLLGIFLGWLIVF